MTALTPKLSVDGNSIKPINVSVVPSISDSITSTVSVTPIVTYDAENSFAYDTSATETISFSFKRVTPDTVNNDGTDTDKWDNAKWMCELVKYINRWQARTDGVLLQYAIAPASTFFPGIYSNAYIRSVSFTRPVGLPDTITGSVSLQVGSMTCKKRTMYDEIALPSPKGYTVEESKQYIQMSSSDGAQYYTLYYVPASGEEFNCISSYDMKGGQQEPFASVTLSIARKRLMNLAPDLIEDIKAGKNRLIINAVGHSEMIVTKCKTSSSTYKITAYAVEEAYKGLQLGVDMECGPDDPFTTPFETIQYILDKTYEVGDTASLRFTEDKIFYNYQTKNNTWSGKVTFSGSKTVWYVLSVCAMRMGCSIWFQDGCVYIVDTTLQVNSSNVTNMTASDYADYSGTTYLNVAPYSPINTKGTEYGFATMVLGTPDLEDAGTDSLANSVTITYTVEENNSTKRAKATTNVNNDTTYMLQSSKGVYGERTAGTLNINELNKDDAQAIADLYPLTLCDTQQAISFKLSETYEDDGVRRWQAYYPPLAQLAKVIDHNSDSMLTRVANFSLKGSVPVNMYNRLMVNSFVRHFPEQTTTYTVGKMAQTDLTQTMSNVLNAVNNSV